MNLAASLALPCLIAALASATHLTQILGAHPWWSNTVIWIGLPVGLVLSGLLWAIGLPKRARVSAFAILTGVGFACAHIGKARFAASYAEDAFAGHMWYFGWIATCALTAAMLASLMIPKRQTH